MLRMPLDHLRKAQRVSQRRRLERSISCQRLEPLISRLGHRRARTLRMRRDRRSQHTQVPIAHRLPQRRVRPLKRQERRFHAAYQLVAGFARASHQQPPSTRRVIERVAARAATSTSATASASVADPYAPLEPCVTFPPPKRRSEDAADLAAQVFDVWPPASPQLGVQPNAARHKRQHIPAYQVDLKRPKPACVASRRAVGVARVRHIRRMHARDCRESLGDGICTSLFRGVAFPDHRRAHLSPYGSRIHKLRSALHTNFDARAWTLIPRMLLMIGRVEYSTQCVAHLEVIVAVFAFVVMSRAQVALRLLKANFDRDDHTGAHGHKPVATPNDCGLARRPCWLRTLLVRLNLLLLLLLLT